jgi:hypothetical protein
MKSRLYLEPWNVSGDTLEVAACLEQDGKTQRLWWRLPAQWQDAVTEWADPFVVGFMFPMMQCGGEVMVEGAVSPSLLKNLDQYAAIWHSWFPSRYQPVRIQAEKEIELPQPNDSPAAIVPFSCGVDSCYTVLRHHRGLMGRRNRKIGAAVIMHGFDIRLDENNASTMYAGLLAGAKAMLDSIDVPCIPVTSNFRELPMIWADGHGTQLTNGLMLFARQFGEAMIPNSTPFTAMVGPWGSHPACDPYLGSKHFPIADDAGENTRFEKIELLSQWPEAMKHLRVCHSNPGNYENCCRCEKCIRTILAFRMVGVLLPPAFKYDVSDRQIRNAKFDSELPFHLWIQLVRGLKELGMDKTSWGKAMCVAERRCRRRWRLQALKKPFVPLRNQLRKLFRGSTLSRRELASAKMQPGAGGVTAPRNSLERS